jgi:hypothetical protein
LKLRTSYIQPNDSPVSSHTRALKYWEETRDGRGAPKWSDISLIDFGTDVVPYINVIDLDTPTKPARYRFWGTGLTKVYGMDLTGNGIDELPSDVKQGAVVGLELLVRNQEPNCEVREFFLPSGLIGRQIVLRLPLSEDGMNTTQAISVCYHELQNESKSASIFFEKVFSAD